MTSGVTASDATGLLTDLYQITMAHAYWKAGLADREASFYVSFRSNPFGGGFTTAAGIGPAVDFVRDLSFSSDDLSYLAELRGQTGEALFEPEFLGALREVDCRCDVSAVREGEVVFPGEPILRVDGPLLESQLVESGILCLVNYQSLIATKAARVVEAAGGDPVLEFGLRRAQGFDGALSASRAAFIGGCEATSNTAAGRRYGIPVRGTHAHSFVQALGSDEDAFAAFASAQPHNAILLVDTYDVQRGVEAAIVAARNLIDRGASLLGIRIDSGDLLEVSRWARHRLDAAGLGEVRIVASDDLDEHRIRGLKASGAPIDVWGVGTRLVTGHGEGALAGVYKLGAVRGPDGKWAPRMKLGTDPSKSSLPGVVDTVRFRRGDLICGDAIADRELGLPTTAAEVEWTDRSPVVHGVELRAEALLHPALRRGRRVAGEERLVDVRSRAARSLRSLPPGLREPSPELVYPVGLEASYASLRRRLTASLRSEERAASPAGS